MNGIKLPITVERAVRAMCDDYDRRALEIRRAKLSPLVIGHYMVLNAAIDQAIAACCEEEICEEMRRNIGDGKGYDFSNLYFLSAGTYNSRKKAFKIAIAQALHLI